MEFNTVFGKNNTVASCSRFPMLLLGKYHNDTVMN